jgi:hypothetical protein
MSGEKSGADVFIKDKELAWVPARLLDQTAEKATVSVASYSDELEITMGGRGADSWSDKVVNLKDYAEFGKQLPLQNNKVLDDMVDLPYLHEVSPSLPKLHYSRYIVENISPRSSFGFNYHLFGRFLLTHSILMTSLH